MHTDSTPNHDRSMRFSRHASLATVQYENAYVGYLGVLGR